MAVLALVLIAAVVAVIVGRQPARDDHTGFATGRPLADLVPPDGLGLVVARADGTVVLRVAAVGSVDPALDPTTPGTTSSTSVLASDAADRQLYAADGGRELLDVAVDPGGEHVLITTVAVGGCDPRLERVAVDSGAVEDLGAGFGATTGPTSTVWMTVDPAASCATTEGQVPRRRGLVASSLVVEDAGARRSLVLPGWGEPSGARPLHSVSVSPDGAVLAVAGTPPSLHALPELPELLEMGADVAPSSGSAVASAVPDGSSTSGVVAWLDDRTVGHVVGGTLALRTAELRSDGVGATAAGEVPIPVAPVVAVEAVRAVTPVTSPGRGTSVELVVVSEDGALHIVGRDGIARSLADGIVDVAIVRPARASGPAPTGPEVPDTAPGTTITPSPTVAAPVERRQRAPMGGTRNVLGWTGALEGEPDRFFLAINGPCTDKVHGDRYAAAYGPGDSTARVSSCAGSPNPEHRPRGYVFVVEVPEGHGDVELVMADPAGPPSTRQAGPPDWPTSARERGSAAVLYRETRFCIECTAATTTVVVVDPDGVPVAQHTIAPKSVMDSRRAFVSREERLVLATIAASSPPGDYRIEVATTDGDGTNAFGLAAFAAGTARACDVTSDATCARVYAAQGLSLGLLGLEAGGAVVPMAQLAEGADTLVIELWDPGEGAEALEVLRPDGSAATFTWEVVGGDGGGVADDLRVGGQVFDGKLVRIDVQLDGGVVAGQWTVGYQPTRMGPVTDRTTWDVFLER